MTAPEPSPPATKCPSCGMFGGAHYANCPELRVVFADRLVDVADLALVLGGDATSFSCDLLRLIAKAQATPEHYALLRLGFPRQVRAWELWQAMPGPPTGEELLAALDREQPAISRDTEPGVRPLEDGWLAITYGEFGRAVRDAWERGCDLAPIFGRLSESAEGPS